MFSFKPFTPKNDTEKELVRLPKDCGCTICKSKRREIKNIIGEKRYFEFCDNCN